MHTMNIPILQYSFLTDFMKRIVQQFYDAMPPMGFHSDHTDEPLPTLSVNDDPIGKEDLIGLFLNGKWKELDKATIQVLHADGTTSTIPYYDYESRGLWPAASFFVTQKLNKAKFSKIVKACVFNGLL